MTIYFICNIVTERLPSTLIRIVGIIKTYIIRLNILMLNCSDFMVGGLYLLLENVRVQR